MSVKAPEEGQYMGDAKQCSKCKAFKPMDHFRADLRYKLGRQSWCRGCKMLARADYRTKYPEKARAAYNKWAKANRHKIRVIRQKYDNTTKGRLNHCMTSAINHSLTKGTKARQRWEFLVGFTVTQLKEHLEKQFIGDMTWGNHGSFWEIDHRIPISAHNFNTPADFDFRRCWSLKNLRPLEKSKNRAKCGKMVKPFQPALQIDYIRRFADKYEKKRGKAGV